MDAPLTGTRRDRGLQIARDKRLKPVVGDKWYVPSQTHATGGYVVDAREGSCTCPDHEETRGKCKHQWAVEFVRTTTVTTVDGEITITQTTTERVKYTQDWKNYNAAQCAEKRHVGELARALCEGIQQPPYKGRGRPALPLTDLVPAAIMKVYSGLSGRRATTDIHEAAQKGLISRAPHYNSIHNTIERPDITPLLKTLIEESATPLKAVESTFAVDSSGFGTSNHRRWFDHKYGKERDDHGWLKAHVTVGTVTNIVTAVEITDGHANDSPQLPALVATTAKRFDMDEVSADKGYVANKNLEAIEAVGAIPFIPFKSNNKGLGPAAWRRMWGLFTYRREEFLEHYHRRSNVETAFHMIKSKFGARVRAKTPIAQANEVLLKVLCHNLSCLTHALYELGVEPTFWTPGEAEQPGVLQ